MVNTDFLYSVEGKDYLGRKQINNKWMKVCSKISSILNADP